MSAGQSVGAVEFGEPSGRTIGGEIGTDTQAVVIEGTADKLNHLPISKVDTGSKHAPILVACDRNGLQFVVPKMPQGEGDGLPTSTRKTDDFEGFIANGG
jgi:hypothetical protein